MDNVRTVLMVDVRLPALGESVDEARIVAWLRRPGERVIAGEPLLEVETDKVNTEIPAPANGELAEILALDGSTVAVGEVIARIGPTAAHPPPGGQPGSPTRLQSPLTRRLVREYGLDPDMVAAGSGSGGRVTASDLRSLVAANRAEPAAASASPNLAPTHSATPDLATTQSTPPAPAPRPTQAEAPPEADFTPFNPIRRRTAERMLLSATTIPQVTTVIEVRYEQVARARQAARRNDGVGLTYLPFITYAAARSLVRFPHLNASVDGSGLWVHRNVHIGIAVDLDHQGLVVPVVHHVTEFGLIDLARRINELADAARARRLSVADHQRGTFTITNPGGYGTFAGTPLINPPQVAILNVDGVSRQPVAVTTADGTEALVIQSVGRLSLAWDHRAVDGAYAGAFLADLRDRLQTTDWTALL